VRISRQSPRVRDGSDILFFVPSLSEVEMREGKKDIADSLTPIFYRGHAQKELFLPLVKFVSNERCFFVVFLGQGSTK